MREVMVEGRSEEVRNWRGECERGNGGGKE